MSSRASLVRQTISVPQSLAGANEILRQIGAEEREVALIEAALNERIDDLKSASLRQLAPHQERIKHLEAALRAYAESHRDILTDHGKRKIIKLAAGIFGWRLRPPSLQLLISEEKLIAFLKRRGLGRFIHTRQEIDRQALKKEPQVVAGIKGISIEQTEKFVCEPAKIEATITQVREEIKKAS